MKATNFDIRVSKETALDLIAPIDSRNGTRGTCLAEEMRIDVMCKEYGLDNREEGDEDWVGIGPADWHTIAEGEEYQTFELWIGK